MTAEQTIAHQRMLTHYRSLGRVIESVQHFPESRAAKNVLAYKKKSEAGTRGRKAAGLKVPVFLKGTRPRK